MVSLLPVSENAKCGNIHFQGRNGHIGSLTRSFKAPVLKAGSQQKVGSAEAPRVAGNFQIG